MTLLHFKLVGEPSELSHSHERSWMMLIMCVPETSTLGIDLSQDWTNASLALVSTLKPSDVPALDFPSLWWDQEQRRALLFCGGVTFPFAGGANSRPSPEAIWSFTPDGKGSGAWNEVLGPAASKPFPPNIIRPSEGASASNGSHAYYIGGFADPYTTTKITSGSQIPVPGLLSFDLDGLSITNTSDGGYFATQDPIHHAVPGAMLDVTSFGTDGLLVLLGGGNTVGSKAPITNPSFNNITIYDKANQKWYSQAATGTIPESRIFFCAVGVQSPDKSTYEMYVNSYSSSIFCSVWDIEMLSES
jgi:hypothetical protein